MVKNNSEVKIWKHIKMFLFIGKIRKLLKNYSFHKNQALSKQKLPNFMYIQPVSSIKI